jgi:hypothetical protein
MKKENVIKLWLLGKTWAEIHRTTGVSTGEISNILADYKKRLDDSDPQVLKDLYSMLSEEHITPSQSAIGFRIMKMIIEMGGNEEKIEAFLSNLKKECIDKKVPPPSAIVPSLQVEDEKLTKDFVKEYTQFKERREAVGLTTKDADADVNVLLNLRALGYDPKKIVAQYSRIKSFESVEKRHQLRCAQWEERIKSYKRTGRLAEWFVLNGYTIPFFDLEKEIIMEIARREGITPAQAKGRLMTAIISYAALDGLIRQVNAINGGISILEKERDDLMNSIATYRYVVDIINALAREIGITKTKVVVDTIWEILASRHYRSNPHALMSDLKELRERRKKEQLQTQQQVRDEVTKLKDGNDGTSSAVPALPKRILKPAGDSSDQCKEEKGGIVSGGEQGGVGNNTHATIIRDASGQHDSNQQNDVSGQQT